MPFSNLDPVHARRYRALMSVFMVFAVLALATALTGLTYIASLNRANGDRIVDCTTPGGKCYKDGSKRTNEAVGAILVRQIAAVACADRPGSQTQPEIQACVERTLKVMEASGD